MDVIFIYNRNSLSNLMGRVNISVTFTPKKVPIHPTKYLSKICLLIYVVRSSYSIVHNSNTKYTKGLVNHNKFFLVIIIKSISLFLSAFFIASAPVTKIPFMVGIFFSQAGGLLGNLNFSSDILPEKISFFKICVCLGIYLLF